MASIRRRGRFYYVRFRTAEGRQSEVKASSDRQVARQLAKDIESNITRERLGLLDPRQAAYADAERVHIATHVKTTFAVWKPLGPFLPT